MKHTLHTLLAPYAGLSRRGKLTALYWAASLALLFATGESIPAAIALTLNFGLASLALVKLVNLPDND